MFDPLRLLIQTLTNMLVSKLYVYYMHVFIDIQKLNTDSKSSEET